MERKGVPQEVVKGELGAKLDDYLTRITPFGFSGALLVAKNGEIVINKGYGMAIKSEGIANTSETVFSTGSITKQFTAAGIMKLEMQGKLNTFDHISKYLPGVPEDKKDITLHHLLTHTSGVINSSGPDFVEAPRDETVKKILSAPLQFSPGEQFSYSNCGYTLLAAMLERVSGKNYEEFLNEYLFKPSGMNFTGYRIPDWAKRVVAYWYSRGRDNLTPMTKPYPQWNLLGNEGILSTTENMYKWHLALSGDSILYRDAKKKLYTPFLNDYAYGWDVMETAHGTVIKHDGGSTLGIGAEFRRYIDADVVFILFSNRDGEEVLFNKGVREKVETIIFGGDVPTPPLIREIEPAALERLKGTYALPSGGRFLVSVEDGSLNIEPVGQDAISVFFFPEKKEASLLSDLNNSSSRIFKAIIDGNYKPIQDALAEGKDPDRFVRFLRRRMQRLQKIIGPLKEVKSVGTLPEPPERGEGLMAVVELKGDKGTAVFGLLWHASSIIGIDLMRQSPTVTPFMLLSDTEFAGYHLGLAKNINIKFSVDESGSVIGLTVLTKWGEVAAKKISTQ